MVTRKVVEILDCSQICGKLDDIKDKQEFETFIQKLGCSMQETGFVYLINHGVPDEVVDGMFSKSRNFFELPAKVKAKYRKSNPAESFHGFSADERIGYLEGAYHEPSVKDFKETLDFWGIAATNDLNFPSEIPELKSTVDTFRSSLLHLSSKLFYAFASFLDLEDKEFFSKQHGALFKDPTIKSHNFIRCNYYFPIDANSIDQNRDNLRLAEHCDVDTMSFLIQDDVGGLEAKLPNGDWIPVPPIPGSIVLNAGSVMDVWSGGNIPATPHRVRVLKDKTMGVRQSVALFVQPDGHVKFSPIVAKIKDGWNPPYNCDPTMPHFEYFTNIIRQIMPYSYT